MKQSDGESASKRMKLSLPSAEEADSLNQADVLMKTNLMQLQMGELLAEVRCERVLQKKSLGVWVSSIKSCLLSAEKMSGAAKKGKTLLNKSWLDASSAACGDIKLCGHFQGNTSVVFAVPQSVDIVGSSETLTATMPFVNIDIVVTMPSNCFDDTDILNHIYFDKRSLYLAALAQVLVSTLGDTLSRDGVEVAYFKGDSRKPILVLKPSNPKLQHVAARVYLAAPAASFKLHQLRSAKNNVRPLAWLQSPEKKRLDPNSLQPTPNYNQAILEDFTFLFHHQIVSKLVAACPQARDAIIVLKIWLTQRSMRFSVDSLDSHCAALLVAYLFQTKRVNAQSTSYGIFLITLRFLAETDLLSSVLDFANADVTSSASSSASIGQPQLLHPLVDPAGKSVQFNVLWRVSASAAHDVRDEARLSLSALVSGDAGAFSQAFLCKRTFFDRHDEFFAVPVTGLHLDVVLSDAAAGSIEEMETRLCDLLLWQYVNSKMKEILDRALLQRVRSVRTCVRTGCSSGESISASSHHPRPSDTVSVVVGLVLDTDRASQRVDRGPSTEDGAAVAAFRSFWGARSEVRRFYDGAIVEAIVWAQDKVKGGGTARPEGIIDEIIRHVLGRHLPQVCGAAGDGVQWSSCFGSQVAPIDSDDPRLAADEETNCRRANEGLDKLRSVLTTELKDMPVGFDSVMGDSAQLRYTSLAPPLPHPLVEGTKEAFKSFYGKTVSLLVAPLAVIGRLESSSKWPSDPAAVEKILSSLQLQLCRLLAEQFGIKAYSHDGHVDIFFRGFVYRLRMVRDQAELQAGPAAAMAAHHNQVRGLHAKFPAYALSVRLLAAWASGHKFSGLLEQEAMELITAFVYTGKQSVYAPTSSFAGFLKALKCIAEWDWGVLPLVVDVDGSLAASAREEVERRFSDARATLLDSHAMYVASADYDAYKLGRPGMEPVVLSLLRAAAAATLQEAAQCVEGGGGLEGLFTNRDFIAANANVVFKFSKSIVSKSPSFRDTGKALVRGPPFCRLEMLANTRKGALSAKTLIVRPGCSPNPIQEEVVAHLRAAYGHLALFFWSETEGSELRLVWRPRALMPSGTVSVLHLRSALHLHSTASHSVTNVAKIVAEMLAESKSFITDVTFLG